MADDISEKQKEAAAILDAPMENAESGYQPDFHTQETWDNLNRDKNNKSDPFAARVSKLTAKLDAQDEAAAAQRAADEAAASPLRGLVKSSVVKGAEKSAQDDKTFNMLDILLEDDEPVKSATPDAAAQAQGFSRNPHEQRPASPPTIESTGGYKAPGVVASEAQRAAINKARQQRNANYRPGTMPRKSD